MGIKKRKLCSKEAGCEKTEEGVSLDVPDGMTGEAGLSINVEPKNESGKKLEGTGELTLSNGDIYNLSVKGKYKSKKDETKYSLKGVDEPAKGIKLKLKIDEESDNATLIKGKAFGQQLDFIATYIPWPTSGWQSTYPEEQGMDSGRLADMLELIQTENHPIRSVLVVRNGYMVTEAYFNPFQKEFSHGLNSCTKSILSALVGIAIDEGYIENEEQKVLDFFPEYNPADVDPWKESITLRHLLMMSSGLDARDNVAYGWEGLYNMMASSDWTQYMLDLPMVAPPGTKFDYSNGASYLIASILQKKTQTTGLEFAHENLFSHLGITASSVEWPINSQGVVHGWGDMSIPPVDMAKFGFLYLHKGLWDGNQIISEEWVNKSTKKQILTSGSTLPLTPEYGFQWWVTQKGYFMALGFAGQYIFVNPAENLVVVFTSALKNSFLPILLYESDILGAILSDEALSDDTEQQARLDDIIKQVSIPPAPEPVPLLPDIANAISGETFYFETNPYGFKTFSLTFTPGADEALYSFYRGDTEIQDAPIGLDNVYRYYLDNNNYLTAYKGQWENETTFVLNVEDFERPPQGVVSQRTFEGSKVTLKDYASTYNGSWEITAEIQ